MLCNPTDGPASTRNLNLKFRQFPGYRGLQNIPQPDQTTELSAQPLADTAGVADSDQESDYSMFSDSEQEPHTDADFAWQERTPLGGSSLATSNDPTPSEVAAPNNEIDGLMDDLDDMIVRIPAAAPVMCATSQLSWTTTTWTSLKHYVFSKHPSHRGPSDFPSEASPMSPVPNGTFRSRVPLVSASASSLLPRPVGRELTDHHGQRQQLEPAATHRVPPGQPSEETESCIELEIGAAVAHVRHLDAHPLVNWITGTSSRAWRGGRTARQLDQPNFLLPGGRAGAGGGGPTPSNDCRTGPD